MKKKPKLSQFERDRIEALGHAGVPQKDIARVLGRDKSTISRELAKNAKKIFVPGCGWTVDRYDADAAQIKAQVRRALASYKGKKIEENEALKQYVVYWLGQCWNPDEISGRMKKENQSFYASKTAIYEWLYSCWGQQYCHLLASKQYRPRKRDKDNPKKKRVMITDRVGIEAKPVQAAHEFGHLEHDTFVSGKKTGGRTAVSVLIEPQSSYAAAIKIPNLKPLTNENAIQSMLEEFKKKDSITRDNGVENKEHAKTAIPSFFCDPYHAVQKPHVENLIKALRRFFRKGSDLGNYTANEIAFAVAILNNKPRKRLGYAKPIELMLENDMLNVENLNRWEVRLAANSNRPMVAIHG
jgi:IS30 family transposase